MIFGKLGGSDFLVRDTTTGQRSVALKDERERSMNFMMGGDVAYVTSSNLLPVASGYTLVSTRVRVRADFYKEFKKASLFYGLTRLGREFAAQLTGQVVGSFSFRTKF